MAHAQDLPFCQKKLPPPPGPKKYGLKPDVESMLRRVKDWKEEDRFELTCELMKTFAEDAERSKKLRNLSRDMNSESSRSNQVPFAGKSEVCGQQRNVDPGASHGGLLPLPALSVVASKVPMICRGDLLKKTDIVFFDTEKVTVADTHDNLSADLAIVDIKGRLLFWTYIHQERVCKFNTKLSGLDQAKLELGLKPDNVMCILEKVLSGKEVWGADSSGDVKSLGFKTYTTVGKKRTFYFPFAKTCDIQDFYKDPNNQPVGLGQLSEHFLGENVQSTTAHSSIADARITALCYRKMLRFKSIGMTRFSCPVMDEIRMTPKPKQQKEKGFFDRCTCGKVQPNNGGKPNKIRKNQNIASFDNFDLDYY